MKSYRKNTGRLAQGPGRRQRRGDNKVQVMCIRDGAGNTRGQNETNRGKTHHKQSTDSFCLTAKSTAWLMFVHVSVKGIFSPFYC